MKIMSWNLNGLKSVIRKNEIQKELESDIYGAILIQETKTNEIIDTLGKDYFKYYISATSKKGYSGVMTFSKNKPLNVIYGIKNEQFDREGRTLTLEFKDYFLINAYFPNSRRDLSRLDYKIKFNKSILKFMQALRRKKPVIIGGDFNVAHNEIDIARPKSNQGNAGFTSVERKFIDEMIKKGYIDTFRIFNKENGNYTWWTYLYKSARTNNIGWRIDYLFVSNELKKRVKDAGIIKNKIGSDHAPVYIELN